MKTRFEMARLIDIAPLASDRVNSFDGERQYLATGGLQFDVIEETEPVTYDERPSRADLTFRLGDVMYARMADTVKVLEVSPSEDDLIVSTGFAIHRPKPDRVHSRYLFHYVRSKFFQRDKNRLSTGATQTAIANKGIKELEIPLPPLDEQHCIAAVLDRADAILAKRHRAQTLLVNLLRSAFVEMFGDPVLNPKGWPTTKLSKVAKVASGVTKGKKIGDRSTVTLPYMRVANVQDGHIDLSEIKEIEVTVEDAQKYALREGDVLLTEGGDPDKLGRGAVWHGEIKPCIHQNHIFRVRTDARKMLPEFASAVIGSERGKRYFLGAAKQTTGIASINKTQLSAFPVLLPPVDLQRQYVALVEEVDRVQDRLTGRDHALDDLYHALAQHAFRGELTIPEMAV